MLFIEHIEKYYPKFCLQKRHGHSSGTNPFVNTGKEKKEWLSRHLWMHHKTQLDFNAVCRRCLSTGHLFHKFGISESDWYRIKQSIDSKCRTAWRRKQRGQSLAVKSFSKRTPRGAGSGTACFSKASNKTNRNLNAICIIPSESAYIHWAPESLAAELLSFLF